jgi:hypothetical protein
VEEVEGQGQQSLPNNSNEDKNVIPLNHSNAEKIYSTYIQ